MKAFLEALSRTTAFRLARLNGLVFLGLAAALVSVASQRHAPLILPLLGADDEDDEEE